MKSGKEKMIGRIWDIYWERRSQGKIESWWQSSLHLSDFCRWPKKRELLIVGKKLLIVGKKFLWWYKMQKQNHSQISILWNGIEFYSTHETSVSQTGSQRILSSSRLSEGASTVCCVLCVVFCVLCAVCYVSLAHMSCAFGRIPPPVWHPVRTWPASRPW